MWKAVSIPFISGQCWNLVFLSRNEAIFCFNPLYIGSMLKCLNFNFNIRKKTVSIPFISGQCWNRSQIHRKWFWGRFQSPLYRVNVEIETKWINGSKDKFQSPLYRVNVEIIQGLIMTNNTQGFNPLYIGSMLKSYFTK